MGLLTLMKSQPLAYNKDNQEDKEPLFDTVDTLINTLRIYTEMMAGIKVKPENMKSAVLQGYATATDLADYLVKKGVPFRDAHGIIGKLVLHCIEKGCAIDDLTVEELQTFAPQFDSDLFEAVSLKTCVEKRLTHGAPGEAAMEKVIALHERGLREMQIGWMVSGQTGRSL